MLTTIIATYGDHDWEKLAWKRAVPSALRDRRAVDGGWVDRPYVVCHGPTLAKARNIGAARAETDWLCFLDADDELAPGYLDAMEESILALGTGRELFTPRVQYVVPGLGNRFREEAPMFHAQVEPAAGNWLVIGTVVPRSLFLEVGGFEEWPLYEDWALFARMQLAGAAVVRVPDAIYRAWRNPAGRNNARAHEERVYWHQRIGHSLWPDQYDETTIAEQRCSRLLDERGMATKQLRRQPSG